MLSATHIFRGIVSIAPKCCVLFSILWCSCGSSSEVDRFFSNWGEGYNVEVASVLVYRLSSPRKDIMRLSNDELERLSKETGVAHGDASRKRQLFFGKRSGKTRKTSSFIVQETVIVMVVEFAGKKHKIVGDMYKNVDTGHFWVYFETSKQANSRSLFRWEEIRKFFDWS